MIRKSVDVIREAAAEQRGFADQVVSPAKLRTKFLENAADLDRAASRMEELEQENQALRDTCAGWRKCDEETKALLASVCRERDRLSAQIDHAAANY